MYRHLKGLIVCISLAVCSLAAQLNLLAAEADYPLSFVQVTDSGASVRTTGFSPDNRFLYAAGNYINVFKRNLSDGSLTKIQTLSLQFLKLGYSIRFSPSGTYMYLAGSMGINVYRRNIETGELSYDESLSVSGIDFSTIEIHQNGKLLYLGSKANHAIYTYSVDVFGKLTLLDTITKDDVYEIRYVTDMVISPDGKHIYASQAAYNGDITVFNIDAGTGLLSLNSIANRDTQPGLTYDNTLGELLVSKDGTLLVSAVGLSGAINIFHRNTETGALTRFQTFHGGITLPDGSTMPDMFGLGYLAQSEDGQMLYGSSGNRGFFIFKKDPDSAGYLFVRSIAHNDTVDGHVLNRLSSATESNSANNKFIYIPSSYHKRVTVLSNTTADAPIDTDGDSVPDSSDAFPNDPTEWSDLDGDGIGSNTDTDDDGDGLLDAEELSLSFDPNDPADAAMDLDNDGLSNLEEVRNSTDMLEADTDGDGLLDGWEVLYGYLPTVTTTTTEDGDGDDLNLLQEQANGTNPTMADTDGDGLKDGWEVSYGYSPTEITVTSEDSDNDGLNLLQEHDAGTNPTLPDTDGDGLKDGWEVLYGYSPTETTVITTDEDGDSLNLLEEHDFGSDPTLADTDNDGLNDGEEKLAGTNPTEPDTDGDGLKDGWEVLYGYSPTEATVTTTDDDGDTLSLLEEHDFGSDPTKADTDNDGLNDGEEKLAVTDPNEPDSDGDGLLDGWEVQNGYSPTEVTVTTADDDGDGLTLLEEQANGTNPTMADTDGDGLKDGWEVSYGYSPTEITVTSVDGDNDGLNLLQEHDAGSNPTLPDTDGDGLKDGWEALYGYSPTETTVTTTDEDGDSLNLLEEHDFGSNPTLVDTDSDGLNDGEEKLAGTNPTVPDTDGDGLKDGWEVLYGYSPTEVTDTTTDEDGDTLNLLEEHDFGSNPTLADTDSDGLNDGEEKLAVTDPNEPDSDGDGLLDGWEVLYGYSPTEATVTTSDEDDDTLSLFEEHEFGSDPTKADTDDDGLNDGEEKLAGTNPTEPDTDGDNLKDGWEVQYGLDPKIPNSPTDDTDGDNLILIDEYNYQTDPNKADTDGDGVSDRVEIDHNTNPNDPNDFPDLVKPVFTLNGATERSTEDANITLTGTVSDNVAIQNVEAQSSQYVGTTFSVSHSNGTWSLELPLKVGVNLATLTATDNAGNNRVLNITITRTEESIPSQVFLTIEKPQNNTVVEFDSILVEGKIVTEIPIDKPVVTIESQTSSAPQSVNASVTQLSPTEFSFKGTVELVNGNNTFVVSTNIEGQNLSEMINITSKDPDQAAELPQLIIVSPMADSVVSTDSIQFVGEAISYAGPITVTINGTRVGYNGTEFSQFNANYSFAEGETSLTLNVVIKDGLNQTVQQTVTYYRDTEGPEITLDNNIVTGGAVNSISDFPYILSGTIADNNLASFTMNGSSIQLEPINENLYSFEIPLALSPGELVNIELKAQDFTRQTKTINFVLQLDVQITAEILSPANNMKLILQGSPIPLQVVGSLAGAVGNEISTLELRDTNGTVLETATMDTTGHLVSTMVNIPQAEGQYILKLLVANSQGASLAQAQVTVTVVNPEPIELAVLRTEPAADFLEAEPNQPIAIYFNKPVSEQLVFELFETAHGKTYIDQDERGVSALHAEGYALETVNRDHELVPSAVEWLNGNTVAMIYPVRDMAYNATLFLNVVNNGQPIIRQSFKTRSLPTFIEGLVSNQMGDPLNGIEISIPKLGRKAFTNRDGAYTFGFGDTESENIPAGRYELRINDQLRDNRYGMQTRWINVTGGDRNEISRTAISLLSPEVPFVFLSSGRVNTIHGGAVKIDLTNTSVNFPNNRTEGTAHVQFTPITFFTFQSMDEFWPFWTYSVQPQGIEVTDSNKLGLEFALPTTENPDDLDLKENELVVILGIDPETKLLLPAGVGAREGNQIVSKRLPGLAVLDQIGFRNYPYKQELLQQFINDTQMSLQSLIIQLQSNDQ